MCEMSGALVWGQPDCLEEQPPESSRGNRARGTGWQRRVELRGPAGRLEALVNEGAPHAPAAVLLCHPHPLGGGTLHNKVVYRAMKALNAPEFELELTVLRFNFRGAGLSEGQHDGAAETEDVWAALDWLESEYGLPIVAAGFSFGAATVLRACCERPRETVRALVALGLPTEAAGRGYSYAFLKSCTIPKLFLSGERDAFAPAAELARVTAGAAEPKRVVLVPGADHFFTGQLRAMQRTLAGWVKEKAP